MDERDSSPEDLESDFDSDDNDSVDESNDNYDSDAIESLGNQLPVSNSRASLRSQCSQYSSSTEEESQSNNLKVRKRRKRKQKSSTSCNNSVNVEKLALIENALNSCDKDKLS